jgi:hypothetical protein
LKKKLTLEERQGLDNSLVSIAEKYLQVHGNNPLSDLEAAPLLEAFLVGYSIQEVVDRYPHVEPSKLIYTAAVKGWHKKRQEVAASIYDRVRAKLVRSVVEQVDYMTDMLSVVSTESKAQVAAYLADPLNNPPPNNRIRSMKEYKDAIDSLMKLTERVSALGHSRDQVIDSSKKKPSKPKIESGFSSKEAATLAVLAGDDE